jgi:urease accessory protein
MPRDLLSHTPWRATLALSFERRDARTVLAQRAHEGPLVVQKSLHPEGDEVCHTIVVHPPGGIAGGDELAIDVRAGERAHVLLTTPGAGRWYRSSGPWARQHVALHAGDEGIIEWLPQETIVFDGARAELLWEAHLAPTARVIAWDIVCLGRTGSGETFTRGEVRTAMRVARNGRARWLERAVLAPGSTALASPVGLEGRSVSGTLLASGASIDDETLSRCRAQTPREGEGAVTRMPHLLVARYRGDGSEAARAYFRALWSILRPAFVGREALEPRIWRT